MKVALLLIMSITGFYEGEIVEDMNKYCIYSSVRGEVIITVGSAEPCPMQIEV